MTPTKLRSELLNLAAELRTDPRKPQQTVSRKLELLADAVVPPEVEIERKYLLDAVPSRCGGSRPSTIRQGYLPGDTLIERLRATISPLGEERYQRTIKVGIGITRIELEEACSKALFDGMWPFTETRRLEKERHRIEDRGLVWEVDVFMDRKLVLAEVELDAPDQPVVFPDWLAQHVVREVTDESEFVNWKLAR